MHHNLKSLKSEKSIKLLKIKETMIQGKLIWYFIEVMTTEAD